MELLADPKLGAKSVATAASQCGAPNVIVGGAALTGLAAAIGPISNRRLIDCLHASIAQIAALMEVRRMNAEAPPVNFS
jgi:Asp/Glu/hydantoin racemase